MSLDIFQHPRVPPLKSGHCYQHSLSPPQQHLGLIFLMPISFKYFHQFSSSSKTHNVYWSSNSKIYQTTLFTEISALQHQNKQGESTDSMGKLPGNHARPKSIQKLHLFDTAKFRRARELRRFKLPIIYSYASIQQMQV